jgi:hypothetical protein
MPCDIAYFQLHGRIDCDMEKFLEVKNVVAILNKIKFHLLLVACHNCTQNNPFQNYGKKNPNICCL